MSANSGVCAGSNLALLASVAFLLSTPALAHSGTGLAGGFLSGFEHPFTGVDHLLAMVCVGIWGAFLGRPLIYALPVVFPAMMVAGAVLGMINVPLPRVELGIALSVLVLGGCIALVLKPPIWAATFVVGLFAIFHGYAHGQELPSAADPIAYSIGFVLATGCLHAGGIAVGFVNKWRTGVIATRSAGVGVCVCGVWFLHRALT